MGQALYRKYRSKSLDEIVGQEHITDTLSRAIKAGKISHAYLFTGPRGVGKTSIARILAHEVNGLDYTNESFHLDIIEIDAASNRRIDEIRDLRDKVHIAPTSARYKVYIIDEVHMLTKEAFNALLKTLEEPPEHVIFILATTEAHKLPDTIVSRTQRFTFKSINQKKTVDHLRLIAKKENIKISEEALNLLANHGGGSFRDSIGLLDQVSGGKDVSEQDVELLLGVAPTKQIQILLEATLEGTPADIVSSLDAFTTKGISSPQIAKQLSSMLRSQLLNGSSSVAPLKITSILSSLLKVSASTDPSSNLEISLFSANIDNSSALSQASTQPTQKFKEVDSKAGKASVKVEPVVKEILQSTPIDGEDISDWWPKFLDSVKRYNNALYGVIRMSHPSLKGDTLRLGFAFSFHAKKISDSETLNKLHATINQLTGRDITIKTWEDKSLKNVVPEPHNTHEESFTLDTEITKVGDESTKINTITSIFGGGEVLEN